MKFIWAFLISTVPLIELRGAIVFTAAQGLPLVASYIVCVVGNILPVPFILLLIRFVLDFMKKKSIFPRLVTWLERKALDGRRRIVKGDGGEEGVPSEVDSAPRLSWGALVGLFLFVAIPLPGTGAWTGSLVAALFRMNRVASFFAIFLGVLVAGVLMSLGAYGIVGALSFIL